MENNGNQWSPRLGARRPASAPPPLCAAFSPHSEMTKQRVGVRGGDSPSRTGHFLPVCVRVQRAAAPAGAADPALDERPPARAARAGRRPGPPRAQGGGGGKCAVRDGLSPPLTPTLCFCAISGILAPSRTSCSPARPAGLAKRSPSAWRASRTHRQTDRHTHTHGGQRPRQALGERYGHTDRQTDRHTHGGQRPRPAPRAGRRAQGGGRRKMCRSGRAVAPPHSNSLLSSRFPESSLRAEEATHGRNLRSSPLGRSV